MKNKDFIIVLAWPEGMTTAAGSWYDLLFAKNGKYRVGHAALILVNSKNKKFYYMDFGRYHTPLGYGRVRDQQTDPDVKISRLAEIENNEIKNIEAVLRETAHKEANHGEGSLYASIVYNINFDSAYNYAKEIQKKGLLKYGPFTINGTNCSRFVSSVIINSKCEKLTKIRLMFPCTLSPSPKRNISISNREFFYVNKLIVQKIKRNYLGSYFKSIERR